METWGPAARALADVGTAVVAGVEVNALVVGVVCAQRAGDGGPEAVHQMRHGLLASVVGFRWVSLRACGAGLAQASMSW